MITNKSVLLEPKYQLLIANLKVRTMRCKDILELLHMENAKHARLAVDRMIMTIGNYYPVYEPLPAQFKILTDEDIEEYQELYRKQKLQKELRKKNGK